MSRTGSGTLEALTGISTLEPSHYPTTWVPLATFTDPEAFTDLERWSDSFKAKAELGVLTVVSGVNLTLLEIST